MDARRRRARRPRRSRGRSFTTSFARIRATQSDRAVRGDREPGRRRVDFRLVRPALERDRLLGDEAVAVRAGRRGRSSLRRRRGTHALAVRREREAEPRVRHGLLEEELPRRRVQQVERLVVRARAEATTTRFRPGVSASANGYGETSVCVPVGVSSRPFGSWTSPVGRRDGTTRSAAEREEERKRENKDLLRKEEREREAALSDRISRASARLGKSRV